MIWHKHTGWRVALCLRRGHADLPMPVPKMNLFGSTQDLREQLLYIQDRFPQSDLYGVGSSAGTGLLVRYLGEEGEQTPLKAAFALCPGYNTETGFANVHPFYSKVMAKKLIKRFIHPYQETWQVCPSWKQLLEVKDLSEFEKLYFELAGFTDYASYTQATNPIYVFESVKIPLMILNAEDDPVCHIRNLEPYKRKNSGDVQYYGDYHQKRQSLRLLSGLDANRILGYPTNGRLFDSAYLVAPATVSA